MSDDKEENSTTRPRSNAVTKKRPKAASRRRANALDPDAVVRATSPDEKAAIKILAQAVRNFEGIKGEVYVRNTTPNQKKKRTNTGPTPGS